MSTFMSPLAILGVDIVSVMKDFRTASLQLSVTVSSLFGHCLFQHHSDVPVQRRPTPELELGLQMW